MDVQDRSRTPSGRDGKPLTAADAAWTINTDIKYQNGGAANEAGLIAHITSASAPNATTLVVHYKRPSGNVLAQFQQFFILPKHIWASTRPQGHRPEDVREPAPIVGSGPFKLVKFQKNQIAIFQPNDTYWGPKPQDRRVRPAAVLERRRAWSTALKAHDLDAIEAVPATAIEDARKLAGFVVSDVPGDSTRRTSSSTRTRRSRRTIASCST